MKKFTKVTLMTAGICLVLGLMITIIAGVMGGFKLLTNDGFLYIGPKGVNINPPFIGTIGTVKDTEKIDENELKNVTELPYSKKDVVNLDIEAGAVILRVVESSNDAFKIASNNKALTVRHDLNGNTLKIEAGERKKKLLDNARGSVVVIAIPKGIEFDDVKITSAAGESKYLPLKAKHVELEVAASDATFEGIVAEDITISVGAGNLQIDKLFAKDIDIEIGMGNADIVLDGDKKDYNYNVEVAMGNLDIDNEKYSNLAAEKSIDNDADKDIDIEVGMGNVTLKYDGE